VVQTSIWAHQDDRTAVRRLRDWNNSIHRVRCRIEKIFGTWKRSYGLRRMHVAGGQARSTLWPTLKADRPPSS
jgi:IS5 family transposase